MDISDIICKKELSDEEMSARIKERLAAMNPPVDPEKSKRSACDKLIKWVMNNEQRRTEFVTWFDLPSSKAHDMLEAIQEGSIITMSETIMKLSLAQVHKARIAMEMADTTSHGEAIHMKPRVAMSDSDFASTVKALQQGMYLDTVLATTQFNCKILAQMSQLIMTRPISQTMAPTYMTRSTVDAAFAKMRATMSTLTETQKAKLFDAILNSLGRVKRALERLDDADLEEVMRVL